MLATLPQASRIRARPAVERLVATAREAGCPPDQVRAFLRAGYVPFPRQWRFHAAARACDRPSGPTEVGFGGARSPGKSHAMLAQLGLDDCQRYAGLKCLLLRKVGKAVKESFEDLRRKVLVGAPHDYKRQAGALHFRNGSRIILGHFKNESDIDAYLGLEYDAIGLEEATTLTRTKRDDIATCLRTSKPGWRPRMYSNANPGGVGHAWYKAMFIEPYRREAETNTRFVPATVDDNPLVNTENRRILDELTGWKKRAWRHGDWDIMAGQFFTNWSQDVHVVSSPVPIPGDWRVWLAMDYGFTHWNVVYLLAETNDGALIVLDEHAERRWLVPRHAEAVRAMLERNRIPPERLATFVAGGDVFAKDDSGQTVADKWAAEGFSLTLANTDRIDGAAAVLDRLGDAEAHLPPRLFVVARCARLIECLPTLQHDPNRPEDVLKVDTDEDGSGGDDCFVAGTRVLTARGPLPIEQIMMGDRVLTRAGYQPVKAVWNSRRSAPVVTATWSDGSTLTATPNHRVWVQDKGWKCIDTMRYGDMIVSPWHMSLNLRSFGSTEFPSAVIPTPDTPTIASISRLVGSTLSRVWGTYTLRYGSQCTAQSLRAITSIIETAIRSITQSKTWNVSAPSTITIFTSRMAACARQLPFASMAESCLSALLTGIVPKRGGSGIESMLSELWQSASLLDSLVSSVVLRSNLANSPKFAFAPTSAGPSGAAFQAQTTWRSLASIAGPSSRPTSTSRCASAASAAPVLRLVDLAANGRADTFALHIHKQHEYFANGVLVSNCYDSMRYGVMVAARRPQTYVGSYKR